MKELSQRIVAIVLAAILFLMNFPIAALASEAAYVNQPTGDSTENGVIDDITADKNSHLINREQNRFEVSIEVPGGDKIEYHDEIILMVDGSYSMDDEWPAMKDAINTIGRAVLNGNGNTQLTLMAFGMGDNIVLEHVKDANELAASLGALPGNLLYGRSSTNCEAGFTGVAKYIENHDDSLGKVNVIFISDGNINTDETPRAFDANWIKWSTKFGALTVAQAAFEGTILYGENISAAVAAVFGNRFDGATREEILTRAFGGGEITNEEFFAFAEKVWDDVYAYSGLTRGVQYPISVAERAFVKYDKENGTYIQDLFYYCTYKSTYVGYGDRWTRTPAAAKALADMEEVNHLYVVDYDAKTSWMDLGHKKSTFVSSDGIAGLVKALEDVIFELAKTTVNDAVVTDYMSKWVNLDAITLKIVDKASNKVIWTAKDGWLIDENRPTSQEVPVIVELVDSTEYEGGGLEVIGNSSGDIYKLTWYVKDGALLRSDSFMLVYEVTSDVDENGFEYDVNYPANGTTKIRFKNKNGKDRTNDIIVPDVDAVKPTLDIVGKKIWRDNNNQDRIRPGSVTIKLLANGKEIDRAEVSLATKWRYSFTDLPRFDGNEEIEYSIEEVDVKGYIATYSGFDVINTHAPETFDIVGNKIWNDDNDKDEIRPDSVTVNLLANGKVIATTQATAENGWTYTFEDLDKYSYGKMIIYSIEEEAVEGYVTTYDGFNIINTHTPEAVKVEGSKIWNDGNDRDGIRPESIVINLLANGKVVDTAEVTAENGWQYSFTDLPKYEGGNEITYSIEEVVVDGYVTTYDGFNIINTHIPKTVNVEGRKIWNDGNDKDGIRPESIVINLLANGEVVDTVEVTAENGWQYSFTDLAKYESGNEITYSIEEVVVDGYVTAYDGYNVINTHVVGTSITLEGIKYLDTEAAEGFTFVLTDENGKEIGTAVSGADGKFTFAELVYTEEGTYVYYISEIVGENEDIIYDQSIYTVTVVVTSDGEKLNASVTLDKDGVSYEGDIEFFNETETVIPDEPAPLDPPKTNPETGDNTAVIAIVIACAIVTLGITFKSKFRRFE